MSAWFIVSKILEVIWSSSMLSHASSTHTKHLQPTKTAQPLITMWSNIPRTYHHFHPPGIFFAFFGVHIHLCSGCAIEDARKKGTSLKCTEGGVQSGGHNLAGGMAVHARLLETLYRPLICTRNFVSLSLSCERTQQEHFTVGKMNQHPTSR